MKNKYAVWVLGIAYDNVTHYKDIMRFIRGSIIGGSGGRRVVGRGSSSGT